MLTHKIIKTPLLKHYSLCTKLRQTSRHICIIYLQNNWAISKFRKCDIECDYLLSLQQNYYFKFWCFLINVYVFEYRNSWCILPESQEFQKFPTTPLSNSYYYFNYSESARWSVKTKTFYLRVALREKGIRCWVQSKDKIASFIPNYEFS